MLSEIYVQINCILTKLRPKARESGNYATLTSPCRSVLQAYAEHTFSACDW